MPAQLLVKTSSFKPVSNQDAKVTPINGVTFVDIGCTAPVRLITIGPSPVLRQDSKVNQIYAGIGPEDQQRQG
jgi:hypothetical protein